MLWCDWVAQEGIDFEEFVQMMVVRDATTAPQEIEHAWQLFHYHDEPVNPTFEIPYP